jgi:hypothetical protein
MEAAMSERVGKGPLSAGRLDAALGSVASSLPSGDLAGEDGLVGGTAREALALEDAQITGSFGL